MSYKEGSAGGNRVVAEPTRSSRGELRGKGRDSAQLEQPYLCRSRWFGRAPRTHCWAADVGLDRAVPGVRSRRQG